MIMDSLLTLSVGDYRVVDLTLRLTSALIGAASLLLGLSTMCVVQSRRLPLIVGSVAMIACSWFEFGVAKAWQGAFELAGSSYCVTGLPLASEDRILAWAMGIPVLLFCYGLVQLDVESRGFRYLCVTTLLMALIAPFLFMATFLGTLVCIGLLAGVTIRPISVTFSNMRNPLRAGLAAIAAGLVLILAGRLHLIPLGTTSETMLVRGEIIRAAGDVCLLFVPAVALLVATLDLSAGKESATRQDKLGTGPLP
jgi:hypothetical protein